MCALGHWRFHFLSLDKYELHLPKLTKQSLVKPKLIHVASFAFNTENLALMKCEGKDHVLKCQISGVSRALSATP